MADGVSRDPSPEVKVSPPGIDPTLRAVSTASVAGTLIIWWPAFTLGAYGAIYFNTLMTIWAVATTVLFSGALLRSRGAIPWGGWIALLLPSTWIVLAIVLPRDGGFSFIRYFEAALTLIAAPMLAWMLSKILVADYATLPWSHRLAAVGATIAVGILAYLLGEFNYLFLTCEDFNASGNRIPADCAERASIRRY
ncbi:hypothetical protein NJL88_16255 [Streptomyces sp. DK15]|uniref:hypothetical protein n=1 Tax=Streptomyces sp. DK15 TaxID=2957499 RepID=UPI0029AFA8BB|nr:hypothetical protein [Streptomyces sp. DK15]MDX2391572.1 hypothetical protein [Streptomyces sp. DK15]